jgi:hypothetical protein
MRTLFPYTTLFRSSGGAVCLVWGRNWTVVHTAPHIWKIFRLHSYTVKQTSYGMLWATQCDSSSLTVRLRTSTICEVVCKNWKRQFISNLNCKFKIVSYSQNKLCHSAQRELFCLTKLSCRNVTQPSWYVNRLCVWSTGKVILRGVLRNICPTATLSNTNPTRGNRLKIDLWMCVCVCVCMYVCIMYVCMYACIIYVI